MQKDAVVAPKDADQVVCDRCGRETVRGETEFYEMTSIGFRAGYGSIFGDGNHVAVDLCQHCLRDTLGAWLRIRDDETDRARAIGRLVKRVQTIVEESGNPEGFNAVEWVTRWIERPCPALGGKTPNEFMGTEDGQALIENLISRMQSGAYS